MGRTSRLAQIQADSQLWTKVTPVAPVAVTGAGGVSVTRVRNVSVSVSVSPRRSLLATNVKSDTDREYRRAQIGAPSETNRRHTGEP